MIKIEAAHICHNCRKAHDAWVVPGKGNLTLSRGATLPDRTTPVIPDTTVKNKCDDCGHLMVGEIIIDSGPLVGKYYLRDVRNVS